MQMISEELILGAGVLAVAIAVTMTKKEKKKKRCSAIKITTVPELDKYEQDLFNLALEVQSSRLYADKGDKKDYEDKVKALLAAADQNFKKAIQQATFSFLTKKIVKELSDNDIAKDATHIGLVTVDKGDICVFGDFTVNTAKLKLISDTYVTEIRLKDKDGPMVGDMMLCQEGKFPGYELKGVTIKPITAFLNASVPAVMDQMPDS